MFIQTIFLTIDKLKVTYNLEDLKEEDKILDILKDEENAEDPRTQDE
jgi:hypothetical protein